MVAVKISDGLGNQLFQYAAGYSLSKRNHSGLILDHTILDTNPKRHYELDRFCLKADRVLGVSQYPSKPLKVAARTMIQRTQFGGFIVVKERELYSYDPSVMEHTGEKVYLDGYWQNYRYFNEYRKELAMMLEPSFRLSDYAEDMVAKMRNEPQSVSVHIRRGDYVGMADLPMSYYEDAVAVINEQFDHPVFYVFSDDAEFAKTALPYLENPVIITNRSSNQSVEDFLMMKSCKAHIIANSTYSWWSAYGSAGAFTVCPIYQVWTDTFYPEEWVRISAER